MKRMPALFIGHGSPMNAIEDNEYSRTWKELGRKLERPRAILSLSAHWTTQGTHVNDAAEPQVVYDMYGFPQELYDLSYPAPGSPDLAHRVQDLLGADVTVDNRWGIDHGTWSVMCRVFPQADIPIVQVSIDRGVANEKRLAIGRVLRPLRDEGVLIFGSGNVVHNLGMVDWSMTGGYAWAEKFDAAVKQRAIDRDFDGLLGYADFPGADLAFPTSEHFDPLLYVLGATHEDDKLTIVNDSCTLGALSMTSYLFE